MIDPTARGRLRAAIMILAMSGFGTVFAGLILSFGVDESYFAYRAMRDGAVILRSIAIVTLAGVILFDTVLPAVKLKPPAILCDILLAVAYVVTSAIVLLRIEHNVSGIGITSAVVTGAIAFSLQNTLANVLGGMALQMDRTIGIGDWIKIDSPALEGMVKEIRWRQTSVETRDWNTVIIPNSLLMNGVVTVLGRRHGQPRQTRRWIYFEIDHGVPANDVIAAVEVALREHPTAGVAESPPPDCVVMDLRNAWQTFAVRYWLTDLPRNDPTDSAVRTRVAAALGREGISFSFPTQQLMLTHQSAAHHRRQDDVEQTRRIEALKSTKLFIPLTDEECHELARRLRLSPFTRGEIITRQGSHADFLYILTRGQAEVRVDADGMYKTVATLRAGDFFGEMALLTGAPRTATVVAMTDVSSYRLDKDSFMDILQRRPSIAEGISAILAQRRLELDAATMHLDEEAKKARLATAEGDLLAKIKNFFGIG
jgi:small-conductance mechanosensitive channel